jgi:hypothetical protein
LTALEGSTSDTSQGSKRQTFFETPESKYSVIGVKVKRNGTGTCHVGFDNLAREDSARLLKFIHHVEHLTVAYMDSDVLTSLQAT